MTIEWQSKFTEASSSFSIALEKMMSRKEYEDASRVFSWAEETTGKMMPISPIFDGNHVSLRICDSIDKLDNADAVFGRIIDYAGEIGVISQIDTKSLRIISTFLISTYLGQKGLICENTLKV